MNQQSRSSGGSAAMNSLTRKKDTGEPGNGGQFGHAQQQASGITLGQSTEPDDRIEAIADLARKAQRTTETLERERANLAEAVGYGPNVDPRTVEETARGMLREGSLSPTQQALVEQGLNRTAELTSEADRLERLTYVYEQQTDVRARKERLLNELASVEADLEQLDKSARRLGGVPVKPREKRMDPYPRGTSVADAIVDQDAALGLEAYRAGHPITERQATALMYQHADANMIDSFAKGEAVDPARIEAAIGARLHAFDRGLHASSPHYVQDSRDALNAVLGWAVGR